MTRIVFFLGLLGAIFSLVEAQSRIVVLRYAHMNSPESIAGMQAPFFARKVEEYSRGSARVEVFPSSLLGSLDEQIALVSEGIVAFHHNTAAGFGTLVEERFGSRWREYYGMIERMR